MYSVGLKDVARVQAVFQPCPPVAALYERERKKMITIKCDDCGKKEQFDSLGDVQAKGWQDLHIKSLDCPRKFRKRAVTHLCSNCREAISRKDFCGGEHC